MTAHTILVTGSRRLVDEQLVTKALDVELAFRGSFMLAVGDCPTGADFFAYKWSQSVAQGFVTVVRFIANWDKNGKAAGPIRNKRMVDFVASLDGKRTCLSFWKDGLPNAGTRNSTSLALEAGIEVHRFHEPADRW